MNVPATPVAEKRHTWSRGLRPVLWWVFLVIVLFGVRTHQRLSENTRLTFSILLKGHPAEEAAVRLDGRAVASGDLVAIGRHTLTVTHPKADSFSTNLFIWYGPHDLGDVVLNRSMGTLAIELCPTARSLTVRGPEFQVRLTNTSGLTSSVPTDTYLVEASSAHWQNQERVAVLPGSTYPGCMDFRAGLAARG